MANEKKINAIADAEQAGLYYSSNTEEGFTRQIKGEEQIFVDSKGKAVKGKSFATTKKSIYFSNRS